MRNEWEKHEGILLQAIPYLGSHRILKVFTPDAGLVTLIAKHIKAKDAAHTTPFCRAEWVFRKSRTEIFSLKEASLLDAMRELSETYEILFAAGSIAGDLLRSQFPHRSSCVLYELLLACLQHLRRNPNAVAQSFRLKLLQFEGLLRLQPTCARCPAAATHISAGECLCSSHAAPGSQLFDAEEWQLMLTLGLGRRFSDFELFKPSPAFIEKTALLFAERFQH
jgi:DNA repair protein RecO (recombination protein O)